MPSNLPTTILILTEHFAPAYSAGGIVRALENLVKHFDNKFEFRILAGNTNLLKTEILRGIEHDRWINFTAGSKAIYLSSRKKRFSTIKAVIDTVRPGVVYINGMYSLFFTILPLLLIKVFYRKLAVVVAPCGMLYKGAIINKPFKKKTYLLLFRVCRLHKRIKWHATDVQEKKDICRFFGKDSNVLVVPLVVSKLPSFKLLPVEKKSGHLKLVTVSLITEKKGHLRLLGLLRDLPKEYVVELHFYGPVKDKVIWKACQREIKALPPSITVIYHGFLDPSNVTYVLQQHHFFVLLTQGENFCQAAYEALDAGRPLIISDQTPWKNLVRHRAGWNVSLNDCETLLNIIKQACDMNQSTFDEYCKGARRKAGHFIDNASYNKQYSGLFS